MEDLKFAPEELAALFINGFHSASMSEREALSEKLAKAKVKYATFDDGGYESRIELKQELQESIRERLRVMLEDESSLDSVWTKEAGEKTVLLMASSLLSSDGSFIWQLYVVDRRIIRVSLKSSFFHLRPTQSEETLIETRVGFLNQLVDAVRQIESRRF